MRINVRDYIKSHIVSQDAGYRGGTIKVDVRELFPYIEDPIVGAYQNYLGGGILGAVVGASHFLPSELKKGDIRLFERLLEGCKKYFHHLTNHNDEWETATYAQNQGRPISAY